MKLSAKILGVIAVLAVVIGVSFVVGYQEDIQREVEPVVEPVVEAVKEPRVGDLRFSIQLDRGRIVLKEYSGLFYRYWDEVKIFDTISEAKKYLRELALERIKIEDEAEMSRRIKEIEDKMWER